MRLSANMAPVETMSITSLVEGIFTTLFQSLGFSTFSLHLVCSFSHFAWRLVITKLEVLSSGRGKKSFSWRARWLPVLKTLFIHWKKRSDTKLAFFFNISISFFDVAENATDGLIRKYKPAAEIEHVWSMVWKKWRNRWILFTVLTFKEIWVHVPILGPFLHLSQ